MLKVATVTESTRGRYGLDPGAFSPASTLMTVREQGSVI